MFPDIMLICMELNLVVSILILMSTPMKNMLIVIPVILVHNICYVVVTSLHTMYYCTEYAYMITDENRFLLLQIKAKFYKLNCKY